MHEPEEALAFAPDDEAAWRRLVRGYRTAGLLLSAHRLGLLHALHQRGEAQLQTLADELVADERLLDLMCRALLAAGVLERTDDFLWRLSESGARLAGDPAASVELDVLANDYLRWGQLDERARRVAVGEPVDADPSDDVIRLGSDFGAARRHALRLSARHRNEVRRLLEPLVPNRPLHVLDVGGGDGQLARAICDRWPDATCTVLELPAMAEVAAQSCEGHERIEVIGGKFFSESPTGVDEPEPLPGPADIVIVSHILHGLSKDEQRELALRTARVLNPGGCLVSSESVLLYDARGPLDVLLWTLGQAAAHHCGHVLTTHEQDTLLRAAGLAAAGEWWVADSTRAVLGVHLAAGVRPALSLSNGEG